MAYKRLEDHGFTWPAVTDGLILLSHAQFEALYRTRDEARADVFDYIERIYNPLRRHSKRGYLSPMEFEARAMLA